MNRTDASVILGKRLTKRIAGNTVLALESFPSHHAIVFHGTVIVRLFDDHMIISTAGHRSMTTRERLNRYLPTGYHVHQSKHLWYLIRPMGMPTLNFNKDMRVDYEPRLPDHLTPAQRKAAQALMARAAPDDLKVLADMWQGACDRSFAAW